LECSAEEEEEEEDDDDDDDDDDVEVNILLHIHLQFIIIRLGHDTCNRVDWYQLFKVTVSIFMVEVACSSDSLVSIY
jgi:hypothetical protein